MTCFFPAAPSSRRFWSIEPWPKCRCWAQDPWDVAMADLRSCHLSIMSYRCHISVFSCCFPTWKHHQFWTTGSQPEEWGIVVWVSNCSWFSWWTDAVCTESLALNCGLEKPCACSVLLGGLPTVHTQVVFSKHSKHCTLAVFKPILSRGNGGV